MTTSVKISVPKPNHKRVQVEQIDISEDGTHSTFARQILNHGDEVEFYVYDIRQLRLTEVD